MGKAKTVEVDLDEEVKPTTKAKKTAAKSARKKHAGILGDADDTIEGVEEAAEKLEAEREAARLAKIEKKFPSEPEVEDTTILIHKRHPCTWCGGHTDHLRVEKDAVSEEVRESKEILVVTKTIKVPKKVASGRGTKATEAVVCPRCEFKVYNSILGEPRHLGKELSTIRGEDTPRAMFPS